MSENLNTIDNTPTHGILFQTADGKLVAYGKNTGNDVSGDTPINVRIPDLKEIEKILTVNLNFNPATRSDAPAQHVIDGNVVGLTVFQINAGTTLTAEVIAIGTP